MILVVNALSSPLVVERDEKMFFLQQIVHMKKELLDDTG
ncbi:protein of unknown function [Bartonella clarridgeiae 73]|uniref:Uncharacterized protein n=1 Tax=Bartonella clarridgeiae (strain CCUG 45776 / CIP 104772 / 73) TaxID=696125 RepID=E6YJ15_BARC7|nr:MAG: hypothetical protein PG977_001306 [Bartonella clarridgeiae]CBI76853.1 protein of unknown function [Bartonella clarridgeiae 73]